MPVLFVGDCTRIDICLGVELRYNQLSGGKLGGQSVVKPGVASGCAESGSGVGPDLDVRIHCFKYRQEFIICFLFRYHTE